MTSPGAAPRLIRSFGYSDMMRHYVEALALLSDESRLRLCLLLHERELRVTDLVRVTGLLQSRVSTHLGRLREAGYVEDRRAGQQSFYTLLFERLPRAARAILDEAATDDDPTAGVRGGPWAGDHGEAAPFFLAPFIGNGRMAAGLPGSGSGCTQTIDSARR